MRRKGRSKDARHTELYLHPFSRREYILSQALAVVKRVLPKKSKF
jgi:hypothetical protein